MITEKEQQLIDKLTDIKNRFENDDYRRDILQNTFFQAFLDENQGLPSIEARKAMKPLFRNGKPSILYRAFFEFDEEDLND